MVFVTDMLGIFFENMFFPLASWADDGPTLQQLTKMIADAKRREKESKGNPALAHAAYDGAVKMALSYLSFHPDQRARLKPIFSEIVQRAKRLKLEATEGAL